MPFRRDESSLSSFLDFGVQFTCARGKYLLRALARDKERNPPANPGGTDLVYAALENHDGWAVAALAVDDEGQIDDTGALQLGNEDDVDIVETGDQTLAAGKFHGQEVDVSILSMRLDRDGLGDIRDHHAA